MRRFEYHQKKQLTKSIVGILLILFLVVFFIFTIGIKLLLNASAFIAGLTNKNVTAPLSKTSDVIGDISIDNIPTATNSARIVVSGSVLNFNILDFYLNGEPVKKVNLTSTDNFSEEIGDLKNGNNDVYIIAKIKNNSAQKKSKIYSVFYKSDKLKLDISEPTDNFKTNKLEIKVKGVTDKETFVKINELPVVVDSQGNFQTTLRLKEGDNRIEIVAQDIAGNTETKSITVTYQKD